MKIVTNLGDCVSGKVLSHQDQVDILLSTYNGFPYLADFLQSIRSQTFGAWNLIVRDDGSSDQSVDFLDDFKGCYINRVEISIGKNNLGIINSLNEIYKLSKSPYVLFADQDDVWCEQKIELSLEKIKVFERELGKDVPIVVFSDMEVTNEKLDLISPSFLSYMSLNPDWSQQLKNLLIQNVASGCSMMMNRALFEKAFPIPSNAIMHDWWVMLVASAFGEIVYLNEATLKYRQHSNNTIGARPIGFSLGWKLLLDNPGFIHDSIYSTQRQAREMIRRYKGQLKPSDRELVKNYAYLSRKNFFNKWWVIIRYRFHKSSLAKSIVFYWLV